MTEEEGEKERRIKFSRSTNDAARSDYRIPSSNFLTLQKLGLNVFRWEKERASDKFPRSEIHREKISFCSDGRAFFSPSDAATLVVAK